MTQTKTGAFLSMGRLPQLFGQAALAASLLAGGASLLNAGGAMALVDDFPPTPFIPSQSVPVDDPAGGEVTLLGISGPTFGAGDVEFDYLGLGSKQVTIDTDWKPNLNTAGATGTFTYSLTAPAGQWWDQFGLTSNMVPGRPGASFSKSVCLALVDGTCPVDALNTLFTTNTGASNGGLLTDLTDLGKPQVIYVTDRFGTDVNNTNALIDNQLNTFHYTPGPLPILGAGAAFGFSRKLRSRIKAARTA